MCDFRISQCPAFSQILKASAQKRDDLQRRINVRNLGGWQMASMFVFDKLRCFRSCHWRDIQQDRAMEISGPYKGGLTNVNLSLAGLKNTAASHGQQRSRFVSDDLCHHIRHTDICGSKKMSPTQAANMM
eukprot:s2802_g1.t1